MKRVIYIKRKIDAKGRISVPIDFLKELDVELGKDHLEIVLVHNDENDQKEIIMSKVKE